MALDEPENPLAVEIHQEMAASYFAACRKMVDSLEALENFDRTTEGSIANNEKLLRRKELLEEAAERVYYVVIQREAMHLTGDESFLDNYAVPDEVRTRLGPRKWK